MSFKATSENNNSFISDQDHTSDEISSILEPVNSHILAELRTQIVSHTVTYESLFKLQYFSA